MAGRTAIALLAVFLSVFMQFCQTANEPEDILAATALFPLFDWCQNIAPSGSQVVLLQPPLAVLPFSELDLTQAKRIHQAKLIVRVGYGWDEWVTEYIQDAVEEKQEIIDLQKWQEERIAEIASSSESERETNPRLWLDPIWAQEAVRCLADRMKAILPEKESEIEERTQAYLLALNRLHREIGEALAILPHKEYAIAGGSFAPFARRYGLAETAYADGKELAEALRNRPRSVIFVETSNQKRGFRVIKEEKAGNVLPLDALGAPNDPERGSYIETMRYNLNSFKKGLSNGVDG
ncbi:MAG: metal ABC transporter substrate-binding protein [Candidatus Omnitrophota bacterium]